LQTNLETLNLFYIDRRSEKVNEIANSFLFHLIDRINYLKNWINLKTNINIDSANNQIRIQSLSYDEIRFPTTLDFIHSLFEHLRIDENYDEPCFQRYIKVILSHIERYDKQQKEYELFIREHDPLFKKIIFPFTEKIKNDPIHRQHLPQDNDVFLSLMKKTPINLIRERGLTESQKFVWDQYSHLIDECYNNNIEFQSFIEEKTKYEQQILETLELLLKDLNALRFEWMNIYHIAVSPTRILPL